MTITYLLMPLALPPPVHGMAVVNQKILQALADTPVKKDVVNLSAGSLVRGVRYHLRRMERISKALLKIALGALRYRSGPRTMYTVLDGGLGAWYTLLLVGLATALRYRVFIHHHAATHTKHATLVCNFITHISPFATHIVLSAGMKTDILARYHTLTDAQVMICCNACHIPVPMDISKPVSRHLRLGMLSNLTEEKGAIRALETALLASEKGLDITLTLAGPVVELGVGDAIVSARKVLRERLITPGPLYDVAKEEFFRNVDVFIFPTLYPQETQGLVNFEAMSHGCYIITYDIGYISEALRNSGCLIKPGMPFAQEALVALLSYKRTGLPRALFELAVEEANRGLNQLKNSVCR